MVIRSLLVAVSLLALLAAPALAQEDETVTRTFRLTLYGDAPPGAWFEVGYLVAPSNDMGGSPICGVPSRTGPSDTPCRGGGTVYTVSVEVPVGAEIRYEFRRFIPGGGGNAEKLATGTETVVADTTNSAYYDFSAGEGGAGDGPQQMPEVPDTGAGALAGAGLRVGSLAAAISLLLAGGYAAVRRR